MFGLISGGVPITYSKSYKKYEIQDCVFYNWWWVPPPEMSPDTGFPPEMNELEPD